MNLFISRKNSGKKMFQSNENTFYSIYVYIALLIDFGVCCFELKIYSNKKISPFTFIKSVLLDLVEKLQSNKPPPGY